MKTNPIFASTKEKSDAGKLLYTRYLAIGIFRMLELAKATDPKALEALVEAGGLETKKVNGDLSMYKGLSPLAAAKELQEEFLERESGRRRREWPRRKPPPPPPRNPRSPPRKELMLLLQRTSERNRPRSPPVVTSRTRAAARPVDNKMRERDAIDRLTATRARSTLVESASPSMSFTEAFKAIPQVRAEPTTRDAKRRLRRIDRRRPDTH